MGRRTIEFAAYEQGDWMFHCHILYHMMEGMARIVSYQKETAHDLASPHYNGHEMKFCCKPCVKKFDANPVKYLAKLPQ